MHYGAEHTHGARASDAWTYRGLRTAILENEELRVVVLADKGGDVASLLHKPTDTEFLWRSPNGVRNPAPYLPTTGDGSSLWIDVYEGGWQTVFPGGGNPASYAGADLGIHAESALLPWDVHVTDEGPATAALALRTRLARTPFTAERTISLRAGSPTLHVEETITNAGGEAFATSYGQHITFGPPFLDASCLIDLPGGTVRNQAEAYVPNHRLRPGAVSAWPHAEGIDGGLVDLRDVPPPGAGHEDMAYVDDMPEGWYALTNTARGVGLAVSYPVTLYRHLWYWQVFSGGSGYPWWRRTYNVGLEPFTSASNAGLEAAIADGSAVTVEAGGSLRSTLRLTAYRSTRGVERVGADGSVVLRTG